MSETHIIGDRCRRLIDKIDTLIDIGLDSDCIDDVRQTNHELDSLQKILQARPGSGDADVVERINVMEELIEEIEQRAYAPRNKTR